MKYLITDPCYIVPDDEWSKFVDDMYGNDSMADEERVLPYKVEGIGTIVRMSNTAYGDGGCTVSENGKSWEIGVDAGLVCLVECDDSLDIEKVSKDKGYALTLGAVTENKTTADRWYAKAQQI